MTPGLWCQSPVLYTSGAVDKYSVLFNHKNVASEHNVASAYVFQRNVIWNNLVLYKCNF